MNMQSTGVARGYSCMRTLETGHASWSWGNKFQAAASGWTEKLSARFSASPPEKSLSHRVKQESANNKTRTAKIIYSGFYLSAIAITDRYSDDRLSRVSMRPTLRLYFYELVLHITGSLPVHPY